MRASVRRARGRELCGVFGSVLRLINRRVYRYHIDGSGGMATGSGKKSGASAAIVDSPRRPIVQPSSFKGEGDFKAWLDKFNRVAKVNEWDEQKKLDFLSVYLDGTAKVMTHLTVFGEFSSIPSLGKTSPPPPCTMLTRHEMTIVPERVINIDWGGGGKFGKRYFF